MKKQQVIYLFLYEILYKMNQNKSNIIIGALLIVFAAIMKVITFPHSFNPIIAIALFSGVVIKDKKMAFAMPLLAMFTSDVMLEVLNIAPGFYGMGQIGNYASLLFITIVGFFVNKNSATNIVGFSITSSLLFFLLSNTNCFLFDNGLTYGPGFQGWATCLAAGIPFVKNSIITDLCFNSVLFGSYYLLHKITVAKANS